MAIFDESEIVAGHQRLATSVSAEHAALDASYDVILKAIRHADVPRHDEDDNANFVFGSMLVSRLVNSASASSILIDRGYFVQSATHLRDLAETAMLILVFSEDINRLTKWRQLEGKERYQQFGRSKLEGMVGSNNRPKFNWLDNYFNRFSEYGGHPSAASVTGQHDGTWFHLGPHFNPELYTNTYKELSLLTWHATDICGELWQTFTGEDLEQIFPEELKVFRDAWDGIAPPRA